MSLLCLSCSFLIGHLILRNLQRLVLALVSIVARQIVAPAIGFF